jgi:hypothetical protein
MFRVYEINRYFGMPFFRNNFSTRKAAKEWIEAQIRSGSSSKFKIEAVR